MMTSRHFITHTSMVFAVALAIAPASALAELKVSGDPGRIVVEAKNASIVEVFAALSEKFNLRYRAPANPQIQINGTYEGDLRNVVTRILAGRNYFINSSANVIEVTVLEKTPVVSTAPANQGSRGPQLLSKQGEGPAPVPGLPGASLPPPEPGAASSTASLPVPKTEGALELMPPSQPSDIPVPTLLVPSPGSQDAIRNAPLR